MIFTKNSATLRHYLSQFSWLIMLLKDFEQQANLWGKSRQPFFFLIDFEMKKPVICSLEEAITLGIQFNLRGVSNVDAANSFAMTEPYQMHAKSVDLAVYKQGFDAVQTELQNGNSYLLNLTYATPIEMNYSFEQIFQRVQASYKLCFKDEFVCFSPECFVRIGQNQISTYPMKGTIRANVPQAEQQLLSSEKEQCEHYTIVDLMRNDLAMVAENIRVNRFRYVEKVGNDEQAILQTSSEIVGDLTENWQKNIGSILLRLLPAGSISGAPKERTVQIIQQAEKQDRGYYTGIFGVFTGESLDSAVAIRFIEKQNGKMYFRSGGGITRHSQLNDEYRELQQKVYVPLG